MTERERNETAADPFCGFNIGSTLYRAVADKNSKPAKFVFESPLLRLVSEFQYQHVYQNGADIVDPDWQPPVDANGRPTKGIPPASVIVYRYYDDGSKYFGDGKVRSIDQYALGLNKLILAVRDLVCQHEAPDGRTIKEDEFKCYLVAHSMGGLVARAFLQNDKLSHPDARKSVSKLFTFATPHNGIEMLDANVPRWLTKSEINTFNRTRMAGFLALSKQNQVSGRVDLIPEDVLDPDRIFCMIGTNRGDYEAAQGLSRAFVGHGSDGLVKIANASVCGVKDGKITRPAATAYAYRAHSGPFGIVNSEEAYQNLVRFLFGDVRVDIWLDIDTLTLPTPLQQRKPGTVDAVYQIELKASPRGKRWFLTRRTAVEDSPACRTHKELTTGTPDRKQIYLSSVFLAKRSRVDQQRDSLAYSMTLAVKVPDYEIDRTFWADGHFEGTDLYRDTAFVEVSPPKEPLEGWPVDFWWASKPSKVSQKVLNFSSGASSGVVEMPFKTTVDPAINGQLRLVVRPWS
ncbi:hypothetical protein A9R05_40145 (plasmid) [Burkholderia sp. KK1]|nr:hypothetical protein A9R05_40145 [Burkholderia sp. KK1]